MRPQYHSPQTFPEFSFRLQATYSIAAANIGRSDVALINKRSGWRPATIRFTYQSPRAVVDSSGVGTGGGSNWAGLYSYYGSTNISGTISLDGGDGTTGGGDGGDIDIYGSEDSDGLGDVRAYGMFITTGGDGTTDGDGGSGGYLYVETYGGTIQMAGSFDGSGGDATGATRWGTSWSTVDYP